MKNGITTMCGWPGAAKTTLLNGPLGEGSVVICPDEFRLELTGKTFYPPAEELVWASLKLAARVLAKRYPVIIDGTHLSVANREQWVVIAQQIGVPIDCFWIATSYETCLKRNALRENPVPEVAMQRMHDSFAPPGYIEGFREIRVQYENDDKIHVLPNVIKNVKLNPDKLDRELG